MIKSSKTMKRLVFSVSGVAMMVSLPSCTAVRAESDRHAAATNSPAAISQPLTRAGMERTVRDDGYRVDASLARFGDRDAVRAGGTQVSSGVFLGAKAQRQAASASLPSHFEGPNAVTITSKTPMSITDIAARLSEVTGLHHVVALGPTGVADSGMTAQSSIVTNTVDENGNTVQSPTANADNYIGGTGGADGMGAAGANDASGAAGKTMIPQLRGPLSRILDEVAATFDVEWEYKDGKIIFRDFLTKQYQISALPSATTGSTTVGGSGGDAGSSMTVSTTSTIDVWADVRNAIAGLVGPGGNISLSPSTGMVTVTAKAGDQERVANYINDLNGTVGHQITFDVNVLTVNLTGSSGNGISLDAVFDSGGVDSDGSRIDTDDGAVNVGIVTGNFSLQAVVKALQKYGQVSVATRAGATTSNNKVTPVNVTDITTYISGMEYPNTGSDNTTSVGTPEIKEIETGFQIQLLPRVMNNREIMVQYALRLSELTGMESVTYPGGVQQLPRISETAMEQQAVLRNGQTLVLAGFERDRTEVNDSAYDLRVAGVGGAIEREKSRVATVLLITPRLVDRQDLARR